MKGVLKWFEGLLADSDYCWSQETVLDQVALGHHLDNGSLWFGWDWSLKDHFVVLWIEDVPNWVLHWSDTKTGQDLQGVVQSQLQTLVNVGLLLLCSALGHGSLQVIDDQQDLLRKLGDSETLFLLHFAHESFTEPDGVFFGLLESILEFLKELQVSLLCKFKSLGCGPQGLDFGPLLVQGFEFLLYSFEMNLGDSLATEGSFQQSESKLERLLQCQVFGEMIGGIFLLQDLRLLLWLLSLRSSISNFVVLSGFGLLSTRL